MLVQCIATSKNYCYNEDNTQKANRIHNNNNSYSYQFIPIHTELLEFYVVHVASIVVIFWSRAADYSCIYR